MWDAICVASLQRSPDVPSQNRTPQEGKGASSSRLPGPKKSGTEEAEMHPRMEIEGGAARRREGGEELRKRRQTKDAQESVPWGSRTKRKRAGEDPRRRNSARRSLSSDDDNESYQRFVKRRLGKEKLYADSWVICANRWNTRSSSQARNCDRLWELKLPRMWGWSRVEKGWNLDSWRRSVQGWVRVNKLIGGVNFLI